MPGLDWNDFAIERVDTGAADLAVRVGGSGPPVVLLHGFPQHSLMWRRVAPILAERFTVIAPDQRGMGASSIPPAVVTKTELAADLARVMDALGHPRAFVAGYDLGAGAAVAFARDHPERVERLAVMEFVLAGFGIKAAMAPRAGWNTDSNWHFGVFAAPDVAVWLFSGREREMLGWFFGHESRVGAAVVPRDDLDAYAPRAVPARRPPGRSRLLRVDLPGRRGQCRAEGAARHAGAGHGRRGRMRGRCCGRSGGPWRATSARR